MHAKPLKRYGRPHYPTRLEVLRERDLLTQHVPPTWRTAEMAGAVAVLLAVNGCTNQEPTSVSKPEAPPQTASISMERRPVAPATARTSPQAAVVAPIFEHGTGRGAIGCVVVAAPAFLSEEEALQVITEQLKQAGVEIARINAALPTVNIRQAKETKPLETDGLTADGVIAFEFVSESDYFNFGGRRSRSTVQDYNLVSVAQSLVQQVADKGYGVYFGAFYDPMQSASGRGSADVRWRERASNAREESKRLLREQVADFVGWLKGQGVI